MKMREEKELVAELESVIIVNFDIMSDNLIR